MRTIKLLGITALLVAALFVASGCNSCSTGDCGTPAPCGPCGY